MISVSNFDYKCSQNTTYTFGVSYDKIHSLDNQITENVYLVLKDTSIIKKMSDSILDIMDVRKDLKAFLE